jgi:hypothetical protein
MDPQNEQEQQEQAQGEIEALKAKAAEAERLQQQLAAANAQNAQQQQAYQQDIARLNAYAQEAIQRATTPSQEPEDEETVRLRQKISEQVQQHLIPVQQGQQVQNRAIQRETAKIKYGEEFGKWEKEIEELLNAYPPNVSAAAGAYDAAYQAVRAKHLDEIIAERVTAEKTKFEAAQQPRRPGAIAPQRTAQGRAAPGSEKEEGPWNDLPDNDRGFLEDFGVTSKDYNQYQGNDYTEDILGFKGRDRV